MYNAETDHFECAAAGGRIQGRHTAPWNRPCADQIHSRGGSRVWSGGDPLGAMPVNTDSCFSGSQVGGGGWTNPWIRPLRHHTDCGGGGLDQPRATPGSAPLRHHTDWVLAPLTRRRSPWRRHRPDASRPPPWRWTTRSSWTCWTRSASCPHCTGAGSPTAGNPTTAAAPRFRPGHPLVTSRVTGPMTSQMERAILMTSRTETVKAWAMRNRKWRRK